jgi:predicted SnoaL-like aldol condensation-catalyzing enzyme
VADPRELVRTIVEQCWSDEAGIERMRGLVTDDYVHHTPMGEWSFDQFCAGVAWIDGRIGERRYLAQQVLADGDLVAAYITWTGIRSEDGSPVDGRGAYHCRLRDGLVCEDWDVFNPGG